jgi:uncharacterized membrane protein
MTGTERHSRNDGNRTHRHLDLRRKRLYREISTLREQTMETELTKYRESRLRSLLKALSWRVVATTTTAIIAWFITGDVATAIAIGSIEFVAKFFIYYGHERAWQLVPRGTIRHIVHPEEA